MPLTTLTFTMPNYGFKSQFVAPYAKAILVTAVLNDMKTIVGLVVLGLPLTAIKMLERQNIPHYQRDEVPEMLLMTIDEYCERKVVQAVNKLSTNLFEALNKAPGTIQ
jgi:hypothetical protein